MSKNLSILSEKLKKNILIKRNKFTTNKNVDIKEIVKEYKYSSGLHSKSYTYYYYTLNYLYIMIRSIIYFYHYNFIFAGLSNVNLYTSRTHTCDQLRIEDSGKSVILCGWLEYVRLNRFIILRDGYGSTQLIIPENASIIIVFS